MTPRSVTNSIIRQLQVVFSISILLLVVSLIASFYSTQELIDNSRLVNHTNEILIESENIISFVKDAETGQRGFLVTLDPTFLQPYNGAREKVVKSYSHLRELTHDNPIQQHNLDEMKVLFEQKFMQMQNIIDMEMKNKINTVKDSVARYTEMVKGKQIMDDMRTVVNGIQSEEKQLLSERTEEQSRYISFTPVLLIIAALISILITAFAYFRIKRDMDERMEQQRIAEQKYVETSERIAVMEDITQLIAEGDYSVRSSDKREDELGRISSALNKMAGSLEDTFNDLNIRNWLQTGAVRLGDAMRGERDLEKLTKNIMSCITEYLHVPVGTFYVISHDAGYRLSSNHAAKNAPATFSTGEGLMGQAAKSGSMIVLNDVPEDYIQIGSSLGSTAPHHLVIIPLNYGGECIGVIELGLLKPATSIELDFIEKNRESIAIAVNAALDYIRLQDFLEETQAQSEELQAQHSELENLNTELEAQAQKLQASEEELRVQQEELQQTNEELEERSGLLEERNVEILRKAEELELTTQYKSEFLANMSHELRTPLNSILLLSRLLSENNEENLSKEQIEYAKVIQSSGNGLLALIDEILDLSKIEAGKMQLEYADIPVQEIVEDMNALFKPMARDKKLDFSINTAGAATSVRTDKTRLEQILKNLISNALKFTSQGSVNLTIRTQPADPNTMYFIVKDTGIGIAPEKQQLIFEAFQQADGSTRRKYGGTGLGLSISRELVKLLGGEISLVSRVNEGSEFTLTIPATANGQKKTVQRKPAPAGVTEEHVEGNPETERPQDKFISTVIPENIPDDRDNITGGDKRILIIEDDTNFAKSVLDFTRRQGYKGIVAVRGDEGLELAEIYKPQGILLDIELPVKSGWEVMDELKKNPETRHIPVHIMSSHKVKNESLQKGAVDYINKPLAFDQMQVMFQKIEHVLNRKSKKVLIIEDNSKHAKALSYFLETFSINSEIRSEISEGIETLKDKEVDCVILDMGIPDIKAYDTLEEAKKNPGMENLPIIIFTGKSLSLAEEQKIRQYADSIIIKTAHSYHRVLDEISLFLHLVEDNKRKNKEVKERKNLGALGQVLSGKTVLIADDDVRNIFSLSKALESFKMNVITAIDGKEAIKKLGEHKHIDIVLLDMMMPQMDGYETARKIRENPRWKNLPVIAVTAKAMTGDREKCINAGASDYITKPVDIDQLISLLRVWLYEQ